MTEVTSRRPANGMQQQPHHQLASPSLLPLPSISLSAAATVSPAKKHKLSELRSSPIAAAAASAGSQEEEQLAQAFSLSCSCKHREDPLANRGNNAPLEHCHLDMEAINAALASSLPPQSIRQSRLTSAPAASSSSSRCQCIQLPPPATAAPSSSSAFSSSSSSSLKALASSSAASSSSSHKRRHISPPLTPHQLYSLTLSSAVNVVQPHASGSTTILAAAAAAATPQRTMVHVRKSRGASSAAHASGSSAPRSPCSSLTVEVPDDENSAGSSPSPLLDSPSHQQDSPLPAPPLHEEPSSLAAVAAAAAATSSLATPQLRSKLASSRSVVLESWMLSSSSSSAAVDADADADDPAADAFDATMLAEIQLIQQEENESELNFLMGHMGQQQEHFMPYIS